jgi:hypothetical protein
MTQVTHPPAQLVREYMARRANERTPPPSPEEIRRQLGRGLEEAVRASERKAIKRG